MSLWPRRIKDSFPNPNEAPGVAPRTVEVDGYDTSALTTICSYTSFAAAAVAVCAAAVGFATGSGAALWVAAAAGLVAFLAFIITWNIGNIFPYKVRAFYPSEQNTAN